MRPSAHHSRYLARSGATQVRLSSSSFQTNAPLTRGPTTIGNANISPLPASPKNSSESNGMNESPEDSARPESKVVLDDSVVRPDKAESEFAKDAVRFREQVPQIRRKPIAEPTLSIGQRLEGGGRVELMVRIEPFDHLLPHASSVIHRSHANRALDR